MSGPPCPDSVPTYYIVTLHTIAIASIPVNLIGFYLVWFQSPKMKGYKYCLCYLQLASFLTECHMSLICPGYYFFPLIAGYNTGAEIITPHMSMTIYTLILAFEIPSALLCFIFRHNAAEKINRSTTPRKMYPEKICIVLTHIFPFATSYAMWKSNLSYQQKQDYLKNNFPQCLKWLSLDAFEVYDYVLNSWLAVVGIGAVSFVVLVYTYGLTLGIHTMSILQRHQKSMSRQMYQMHKTALFSLFMQLLIPGMLIVVPLSVCMFVVVTGAVGLQEVATNTMFLVGSHSMCSCTVMILSNGRYRKFVMAKILRINKANKKISTEQSQRGNSVFVIQNTTN